jgi:hypothetical protein
MPSGVFTPIVMRRPASKTMFASVAYFSSFPMGLTTTFRSLAVSAALFCITRSSPAGFALESMTAKGCCCAHFARPASSPADAPQPGKKPRREAAMMPIIRTTARMITYSVVEVARID